MTMHQRWIQSVRRLPCAAAAALLACVAATAQGQTIAWWDFEEDLLAGVPMDGDVVSHPGDPAAFDAAIPDLSGNGNHLSAFDDEGGTVMEFANFVSPVNQTGSNFSMSNGAGAPVLSSDGDLEVGGVKVEELSEWTIEASVYMNELGAWRTFVGKDGIGEATQGDVNQASLYFQKTGDGNNLFRINYVDVDGFAHIVDSTTVAQPNQWYNLAATSDGSMLRIFVNGTEEGSFDLTGTASTNTAMVALDEEGSENDEGLVPYAWSLFRGMYNNGHVDRVDGFIDDVRISNVALTPDEFLNAEAISPVTLYVDPDTGEVTIRNELASAVEFDYYRVDSPAGSLVTSDLSGGVGWDSLSDQERDAIGDGAGESWDEVDAAVSENRLVEEFLQGSTTLASGQSASLGAPWDGSAEDLTFQFGLVGGNLISGTVLYEAAPQATPGDFNEDGVVGPQDYVVWRDGLGTQYTAADYQDWVDNYGTTSGASAAANAPEPATGVLLLVAGGLVVARRRA